MNKGVWAGITIAVIAIVMVSTNPVIAQEADKGWKNLITLGGLACSDGETVKFLDGEWRCASNDTTSISEVLKLEPQSSEPVACTVDNIGTLYINDGPQFDGVCVCAEYGGSPQYVELTGTGTC